MRGGALGGGDRFADADDSARAGEPRALDRRVAIVVERGVGEVGVAVDERRHAKTNRRTKRGCSRRSRQRVPTGVGRSRRPSASARAVPLFSAAGVARPLVLDPEQDRRRRRRWS